MSVTVEEPTPVRGRLAEQGARRFRDVLRRTRRVLRHPRAHPSPAAPAAARRAFPGPRHRPGQCEPRLRRVSAAARRGHRRPQEGRVVARHQLSGAAAARRTYWCWSSTTTGSGSPIWCCAWPPLAVLVAARGEFYARTRRGALRRALLVLVLGLAAGRTGRLGSRRAVPRRAAARASVCCGPPTGCCGGLVSGDQFDGHPPRFLFFLLGLFGAIALLSAAATLFRSQRMEAALHGDEEPRIRALLGAYGSQDSLGYFATRRDKAVVFSPSGKAAVTYRVEAGVCSGQRRSGGRPGGLDPGHRRLAGRRQALRLGPGGHGRLRGRRQSLRALRARRDPARRRGDPARRPLRPGRPRHARHPAGREPGQADRRHRPDPPALRPVRRRDAGASSTRPTPGATPRPNAASPWPWTASATPPTGTACSSRPSTATAI